MRLSIFSMCMAWACIALEARAEDNTIAVSGSITVTIGEDPNATPSKVGWTEGVCYQPIVSGVHPGDKLRFEFTGHNVYQMASKEHFLGCNFTDAVLLAQVGETPFEYEITEDVSGDVLYFACQVSDHCGGGTQKVQVAVTAFWGTNAVDRPAVTSGYTLGNSVEACNDIQEAGAISESEAQLASQLQSTCSEPEPVEGQDNTFFRTCLSGPATLTPGGVINRLFLMQDPFPRDHRVAIGQRTFEFVYDTPDGVVAAPVNQLYVHHLSGRVVFGQGAEGIRQEAPDAPFAPPYAHVSGDEGDSMVFHLIDLRQVDDWLGCIECRCPVGTPGTYFDALTNTGNLTGGVNCCSNCTSLTEPTLDYRMRYNISYREFTPETPSVTVVQMLTSDISTAAGKFLEHDVPSAAFLPVEQQAPDNPAVQRLIKEGPFNELFQEEFFDGPYSGSSMVQLLRCSAHLHVASIEMYLEDTVTGERLCDGQTEYGKDPATNKGFLTAVSVDDYDPPKTFPADRVVRFVTDYNATNLHTGVMGYWFLFVAGSEVVNSTVANMTVNVCMESTCNVEWLPQMDMTPFQQDPAIEPPADAAVTNRQSTNTTDCVDTLAESPSCTFGGLCDCESFVNAPESTGCDGFYTSPMGDVNVRSVCANYCGCDVSVAIEEATSTNKEDCVDTLVDHPSCTFGGLCDCETFATAPEAADGCDGVYVTSMGNVTVREVCANFCGCDGAVEVEQAAAPTAAPAPMGCEDKLKEHPSCRFGGMCDCEEFVNAPESEGCGGAFKSDMGDVIINDVCAAYCGACADTSTEEFFQQTYLEVLTEQMRGVCHFATSDCKAMLNNLYSCSQGMPGIENADPMVQTAVKKMGQQVAMETAKLGHASMHVGEKDQEVVEMCVDISKAEVDNEEKESNGIASGASTNFVGTISILTVVSWVVTQLLQ